VFDNYAVGDRVRYHGFMDYVEKYDKRNSKYILCAKCGNDNDPRLDRCSHCDKPLLKGSGHASAPLPGDPNAHITRIGFDKPDNGRPQTGSNWRRNTLLGLAFIIFILIFAYFTSAR
jgi:ribosomal protein L40E